MICILALSRPIFGKKMLPKRQHTFCNTTDYFSWVNTTDDQALQLLVWAPNEEMN